MVLIFDDLCLILCNKRPSYRDTPQKIEYHFESIQRMRSLEMDEKEYVLIKAIVVCDPSEFIDLYDSMRFRISKNVTSLQRLMVSPTTVGML